MRNSLGKNEFQSALGFLRAELVQVRDDFQHQKITHEAYQHKADMLVTRAHHFQTEYKGSSPAVLITLFD